MALTLMGILVISAFIAGWLVGRKWSDRLEKKARKVMDILDE